MTELKELFKEREDTFNTISAKIFESLPNVLEGCKLFVAEQGGDVELLEWDNVSFMYEEDLVVLMGSLAYNPGDKVTLPSGERVEVTENTAPYFRAMLRLGIPYKLANTGSTEEVLTFLKETIEVEEVPDRDPVGAATGEMVAHTAEFDLGELTDDQRAAMELFVTSEMMKKEPEQN